MRGAGHIVDHDNRPLIMKQIDPSVLGPATPASNLDVDHIDLTTRRERDDLRLVELRELVLRHLGVASVPTDLEIS